MVVKGRVRKLRNLTKLLDLFKDRKWKRFSEIWVNLNKIKPKPDIDERTLKRYLKKLVEMGCLEMSYGPEGARYRLSESGGLIILSSVISSFIRMQSDIYPDLKKGALTLEIKRNGEIYGLIILLQESDRKAFTEKWKDKEWGRAVSRSIIHLIKEYINPKKPFVFKIPDTRWFFLNVPPKICELMESAVRSGHYELEEDIIIHALNRWANSYSMHNQT